ncbi:carbohydrate kinase [Streptodolium elevatio]|uniref:Carbohydrate kinase n=1 Tax=Streptodolium elevatio TaxID=3157996 RepID=A0ABV3DMY1_9ACTN
MALTDREREIVDLLRGDPRLSPGEIAGRLGTTRAAVNVHLSNLTRKGVVLGRGYILSEEPSVVVVGGANLDIKARSAATAILGTSNPGSGSMAAGGVGRNIAENLARLGTPTYLIAAVGVDATGERLLADTAAAGVRLDHMHRSRHPTGTYTAVLDAGGELVLAVADMTATEHLLPEHLSPLRELLAHAGLLVLDGNLTAATASHALDLGQAAGVPTLMEPVSVPKAATLAPLIAADRPLYAVTPNREELTALTGLPTGSDGELLAATGNLHERGVSHVWVRLGARGSLLSSLDEGHVFVPALPAGVKDVTGAGDAMLAAFAHALLAGHPVRSAVEHGTAAAALTIESAHTVRPDLSPRLLAQALAERGGSGRPGDPRASAAPTGTPRSSTPRSSTPN